MSEIITPDDELSDEENENLEMVVIGAYPTVIGEWTGEEWVLEPGVDATPEEFTKEIEYIKSFNIPGISEEA